MLTRTAILAATAAAVAIAAASAAAQAQDKAITVFAAASMKNALDDVDAAFTKQSGIKVVASYDASSVFGFFMILCAAGGVILGAVAALVLDRISVRRAERAVVEPVPDSVPDADDDGNRI